MSDAMSRRTLLGATSLALIGGAGVGPAAAAPAGEAVLDRAMQEASTGLLVVQDGKILAERYAEGWTAEQPHQLASAAKSILGMLLCMAVEDGSITGLNQPAADFVPAWRSDGRRAITLRHLMSMTSGLDDAGLALRNVTGDQFTINAAAPLRAPPGTRWAYNTAAYHLLFHILAAATGESVEAYAQRRLIGPLEMKHTTWITNTGQGAAGPVTNYYSAASTPRDLARLGTLVLNGGKWGDRQLISAEHLRLLTTPSQDLNPSYGLLWWCNARPGQDATGLVEGYRFPQAPRDTFAALGAGGQVLLIVPSRRLLIIRLGGPPRSRDLFDDLLAAYAGKA